MREDLRGRVTCGIKQSVMSRWDSSIVAEKSDNTISIFEPIGADWWTGEGMTAKRMAGILRTIKGDVTVNINSPGGDVFEGLTIYNLLRQHEGSVTVNVLGLAASAASIIAMAADDLRMAKASFLMIHNAWTVASGSKEDLIEIAGMLTEVDSSLASVYADRTGKDQSEVEKLMSAETWLSGETAVNDGFADGLLDSDTERAEDGEAKNAMYRLDAAMAQAGMPRSERKKILKDLTMHDAGDSMRIAGSSEATRNILAELVVNL